MRGMALALIWSSLLLIGIGPFPAAQVVPEQTPTSPRRKHALLIGVDYRRPDFNHKRHWYPLNTAADVAAVKKMLKERFGFQEGEIEVLQTRKQTTQEAILKAFDRLIKATQEGSIVYLHYSGHGSTAPNPQKPSGQDQTIVPSDSPGYEDPSRDIRGPRIKQFLDALLARRPANVTLVFDCCHAGGNTRGGRMLVRGRQRPPATPVPSQAVTHRKPEETALVAERVMGDPGYIALFAARSDQLAKEWDNPAMGSLTYALIRAVNESGPNITYRDLIARINSYIVQKCPDQNPQIMGRIDTVLLGTEVRPVSRFIPTDWQGGKAVLLAGTLQGIAPGTTVRIYAQGADIHNARPLTEATVESCEATLSYLKLAQPAVAGDRLRGARAVIKELKVPWTALKVDIAGLKEHPRREAILREIQALQKSGLVQPVTNAPDWQVRVTTAPSSNRGASNTLRLEYLDGTALMVAKDDDRTQFLTDLPDTAAISGQIRQILENRARWQALNAINIPESKYGIKIEVRVIPIAVRKEKRPNGMNYLIYEKDLPITPGAPLEFNLGDYFRIEVENHGTQTAHVSLLCLNADGAIQSLWPDRNIPTPNSIEKGKTIKINYADGTPVIWEVADPVGKEVIKAIATREPSDFSPLANVQTRGKGSDISRTPLGILIQNAIWGQRAKPIIPDFADWATYTVVYTVRKP